MSVPSKAGAWVSGAVISLMAFSASARPEVLFDSLDSPTLAVLNPGPNFLPLDASRPVLRPFTRPTSRSC
jgi:hypothetical protein